MVNKGSILGLEMLYQILKGFSTSLEGFSNDKGPPVAYVGVLCVV